LFAFEVFRNPEIIRILFMEEKRRRQEKRGFKNSLAYFSASLFGL
jgi:hypothetical protein